MNKKPQKGLKISQLAKLTDVPTATIKYYLQKSLLPKPIKTGKTMAYYDPSCVERVKLIKKLQREKFLPLSIIRRIIDSKSEINDEFEIGHIIAKSDRVLQGNGLLHEEDLARITGYPLKKIRYLENEGLLNPLISNGIKTYDALDRQIVEISQKREEMDLPFEYTVNVLKIYRQKILQAIIADNRWFFKGLTDDIPMTNALKRTREADELVERFILIIRQKLLSIINPIGFGELDNLTAKLTDIRFLPLPGEYLPSSIPRNPWYKTIYYFCRLNSEGIFNSLEKLKLKGDIGFYITASVLAHIFFGKPDAAIEFSLKYKQYASKKPMVSIAFGLAHIASGAASSGFSQPADLVKKGLAFFPVEQQKTFEADLSSFFCGYVTGIVFAVLPWVFETRELGLVILKRLNKEIRKYRLPKGKLPKWLHQTLKYEMFPEMLICVNRYLHEAEQDPLDSFHLKS